MRINFNELNEMTMPGMNHGTGQMTVRMYHDDKYRIIPTVIHAGGSIGLHRRISLGRRYAYLPKGLGAHDYEYGRGRPCDADDSGCKIILVSI